MSPTILRILQAHERQVRRWQGSECGYWLRLGMPASARFYSRRDNWPDALTMARDAMYWLERA